MIMPVPGTDTIIARSPRAWGRAPPLRDDGPSP